MILWNPLVQMGFLSQRLTNRPTDGASMRKDSLITFYQGQGGFPRPFLPALKETAAGMTSHHLAW